MLSSIIDGLRRAGLVLMVGALAGIAVQAGAKGSFAVQAWSPVVIGNSVLVGVLYVALIDATTRLVRLVTEAFVPLESDQDVAVHALAPAGGVLLVFVGLTAGLKGALGATFSIAWPLLLGVGSVAALTVGVASGFIALREYYRRDRQDHAEGWEARMRRLRTQSCPPILFDTLNTMEALLENRPEDVLPLLERLQDLLHYRQQAGSGDPVPLANEIDVALSYVELVQVQYGDDLEVGFDVPDALLSVPVPRLTLLPLLENAVQHGAAVQNDACTITVTGRHDDQQVCLAVLDTGPGFDTTDPGTVLRRGSGISDLYARLREHFGPGAELSLLPQGVLWCAPLGDHTRSPPSGESEAEAGSSSG